MKDERKDATNMGYRAVIDEDICAAIGNCAEIAPQVFVVGEIAAVVGDGPDDLLLEAARRCPSVAISIVDDETGKRIYP